MQQQGMERCAGKAEAQAERQKGVGRKEGRHTRHACRQGRHKATRQARQK